LFFRGPGARGAFVCSNFLEAGLAFLPGDFVEAFLIRLATAVPSVSHLPSQFPDPADGPTEHVPGREKREALEGEGMKPIKHFRDDERARSGWQFLRRQP
jgi:hypothetical protein